MSTNGPGHRCVIVVAEQDPMLRRALVGALTRLDCAVRESRNRTDLCREVSAAEVHAIVLGASLERQEDGLEALADLRARGCRAPCVLLARVSSERTAIAAIRAGVADYFPPPFVPDDVAASVARLIGRHPAPIADSGMVGDSPAMQALRQDIGRIAQSDSHVLVTGETGTGKGLAAESIHRTSRRARQPFLSINCAAIPETLLESELFGHERGAFTGAERPKEGLLQAAGAGTVLLDEIGDMSLAAQAKILRVLEDRTLQRLGGTRSIPVDVRMIAATNQALDVLMRDGRFRRDLYYRVNVARVHLPPLRERVSDIPKLIAFYVADLNRRFGRTVETVADEVMDAFVRYTWPGNVRELKNLLEAIFVHLPARPVTVLQLPDRIRRELDAGSPSGERERLIAALLATRWNKSKAAQQLQWSRMTLYRKVRKYQIDGPADSGAAPPSSAEPPRAARA